MARQYDPRRELLQVLLEKVANDQYPSVTQLDMIEDMLSPDEIEAYSEVLLEKVRDETYPSIDMLRRLRGLSA
jgi:hypothetical protein